MSDVHLVSYINMHLAGLLGATNMLRNFCRKEISLELYRFFVRLQVEMSEDQKSLHNLLLGLGAPQAVKRKQSRELASQEGLRFYFARTETDPEGEELLEALEWLTLEIQAKALLWLTLAAVARTVPAWRGVDFKSLEQRAKNQRDRTESVRMEMACGVLRAD